MLSDLVHRFLLLCAVATGLAFVVGLITSNPGFALLAATVVFGVAYGIAVANRMLATHSDAGRTDGKGDQ